MAETENEWLKWLKCNVLEVIILVLVLVLMVKAFSAPATAVQELLPTEAVLLEAPAAEGDAEKVIDGPVELPVLNQTLQTPAESNTSG